MSLSYSDSEFDSEVEEIEHSLYAQLYHEEKQDHSLPVEEESVFDHAEHNTQHNRCQSKPQSEILYELKTKSTLLYGKGSPMDKHYGASDVSFGTKKDASINNTTDKQIPVNALCSNLPASSVTTGGRKAADNDVAYRNIKTASIDPTVNGKVDYNNQYATGADILTQGSVACTTDIQRTDETSRKLGSLNARKSTKLHTWYDTFEGSIALGLFRMPHDTKQSHKLSQSNKHTSGTISGRVELDHLYCNTSNLETMFRNGASEYDFAMHNIDSILSEKTATKKVKKQGIKRKRSLENVSSCSEFPKPKKSSEQTPMRKSVVLPRENIASVLFNQNNAKHCHNPSLNENFDKARSESRCHSMTHLTSKVIGNNAKSAFSSKVNSGSTVTLSSDNNTIVLSSDNLSDDDIESSMHVGEQQCQNYLSVERRNYGSSALKSKSAHRSVDACSENTDEINSSDLEEDSRCSMIGRKKALSEGRSVVCKSLCSIKTNNNAEDMIHQDSKNGVKTKSLHVSFEHQFKCLSDGTAKLSSTVPLRNTGISSLSSKCDSQGISLYPIKSKKQCQNVFDWKGSAYKHIQTNIKESTHPYGLALIVPQTAESYANFSQATLSASGKPTCPHWTKEMAEFYDTDIDYEFSVADIQQQQSDSPKYWCINARDYMCGDGFNRYFSRSDRCLICRQYGHTKEECDRVLRCYLCSETTHTKRVNCPQNCCFRCGGKLHVFCKLTTMSTTCFLCGNKGHQSMICPDIWRRYHLTTFGDEPLQPDKQVKNRKQYCYICAGKGHLGHECPDRIRGYTVLPVPTTIASYKNPFKTSRKLQHDYLISSGGDYKRMQRARSTSSYSVTEMQGDEIAESVTKTNSKSEFDSHNHILNDVFRNSVDSFKKSHTACSALINGLCNWLKFPYNKNNMINRVSEMFNIVKDLHVDVQQHLYILSKAGSDGSLNYNADSVKSSFRKLAVFLIGQKQLGYGYETCLKIKKALHLLKEAKSAAVVCNTRNNLLHNLKKVFDPPVCLISEIIGLAKSYLDRENINKEYSNYLYKKETVRKIDSKNQLLLEGNKRKHLEIYSSNTRKQSSFRETVKMKNNMAEISNKRMVSTEFKRKFKQKKAYQRRLNLKIEKYMGPLEK